MEADAITAAAVRDALRAIRCAKPLRASPLLGLALLEVRLSEQGRSDTPDARTSELPRLLDDIVGREVAQRRGTAATKARPDATLADELALLRQDFESGDIGRQMWGTLHYRFLSGAETPVQSAVDALGVPARTLQRRAARGCEALVEVLRSAERDAVARQTRYRTVTLLCAEIVVPSRVPQGDGQPLETAREALAASLASAAQRGGGRMLRSARGTLCYEFADPTDALVSAVRAQRRWAVEQGMEPAPGPPTSRVRMAIHHGRVEARGAEVVGPEVDRTAGLLEAAHGGQILLSLAAEEVVRDFLPHEVGLRDWGERRMPGLRRPERIWQVLAPGVPDVAAAPHAGGRVRGRDPLAGSPAASGPASADAAAALLAAAREGAPSATMSPAQLTEVLGRPVADLTDYRLRRIAEWSGPRYRLDRHFVPLVLTVDRNARGGPGRRPAFETRFQDLRALLHDIAEPAVVLLGPPGSGKSTLLRRLELDLCVAALLEPASPIAVPFFLQLNEYGPERPGALPPSPADWLSERWTARYPDLVSLDTLIAEGRMVLLLDALDEIPVRSEGGIYEPVQLWKAWLRQLTAEMPGNRVVFSCRSLDYTAPLSSPAVPVPQVRIEPLSDDRVIELLRVWLPRRWRRVWRRLAGSRDRTVVPRPYMLHLFAEQAATADDLPRGTAALFTVFVRNALLREVERGNPLFAPDRLLEGRDVQRIASRGWRSPWDLPERGRLVPKLSALAREMQLRDTGSERSGVRIGLDAALSILDDPRGEEIVAAGEALGVLDEDQTVEALMFSHVQLQEYFAARAVTARAAGEVVRTEWRAARIRPALEDVIASLSPAEPLPSLPRTGWEETAGFATAMAADPAGYIQAVANGNLALAGRIACQDDVRQRVGEDVVEPLRWALVRRSRDAAADLRERIACGLVVGELGDPRFDRRVGPDGDALVPPFVDRPEGVFPIGDDAPIHWKLTGTGDEAVDTDHCPRHAVRVGAFRIARFAVTNAEWACFMAAGGYEDDRWWQTADARRWRRGELPCDGPKLRSRLWRRRFSDDPALLERIIGQGVLPDEEAIERWRRWMTLDEPAFERCLEERYPAVHRAEPEHWRDERLNGPAQPVVGIGWYEACAYCAWLFAQTGLPVRLPTEVEWESAARGMAARPYPWGDETGGLRANTSEAHVRRTTPVGVFPAGDTPDGIADMSGNVYEWTASLWGDFSTEEPIVGFPYPYDATDGREDAAAAASVARVCRGGAWAGFLPEACATMRTGTRPDHAMPSFGLRLAADME